MFGVEVQREGAVWLLEDRETVVRMARIGQLGPGDAVREDRAGDWCPAREVPWLSVAFEGDPWDAWEELDGQDPESIWAACAVPVESDEDPIEDTDLRLKREPDPEPILETEEAPPPAPTMSVSFEPAAPRVATPARKPQRTRPTQTRARPRPPVAPTVSPPVAPAALGPGAAMGQVIEFPAGRGSAAPALASELPSALLQPLEVEDLVPSEGERLRIHKGPPPAEPRSLAPWLLVMALVLCLAAFGLSLWSVQLSANWTSPRTAAAPVAPAVEGAAPIVVAEPVAASPVIDDAAMVDELAQLHAELRARIPDTALELEGGPDDLASALLIELSNMRLGPVKVSAPVVSWTGAQNDVVAVADIEVHLTTAGSIERELTAVGLVVGKYLQQYGFRVRSFTVIVTGEDGATRQRRIDPDAARNLWTGRKNLYEFLMGR